MLTSQTAKSRHHLRSAHLAKHLLAEASQNSSTTEYLSKSRRKSDSRIMHDEELEGVLKKGKRKSRKPSYLKGTVSSTNKTMYKKLNNLENIFFDKRDKNNLLTESELRDSNIRLTGDSTFLKNRRKTDFTTFFDKGELI